MERLWKVFACMKGCIRITAVAAMLHFLVDGLCACCLYMLVPFFYAEQMMAYILVYNVLAFMSQPLTGIMADMLERRNRMMWGAAANMFIAVCMVAALPYTEGKLLQSVGFAISVLLGMGNSLFHVWGGKRIVMQVGNEIGHLGVYVSTGALGLSVGLLFNSWLLVCILLFGICLFSSVCTFCPEPSVDSVTQKPFSRIIPWKGYIASGLILLIMLLVSSRSYFGSVMSSMIVMNGMVVLVAGVVSMLGKMVGGWLVHRWGVIRILLFLSLLVIVSLWFHDGFLGIFAINCTMPLTLFWANVLLKGREAFAFGLLAFALVPGYYLFYML